MKITTLAGLFTATLFLSACGNPFSSNSSVGPATPEPSYLGKSSVSYGSSPFKVQATAKFRYRPTVYTGGSGSGLYAPDTNSIDLIPYAEFQVYNEGGSLVQAGETDASGVALFDMPSTTGTYTLKIMSRALNDNLKISILQDKYKNQPYSIAKSFTITSAILSGSSPYNVGEVIAEADETVSATIEGAAFNIYNQILLANKYIRTQISNPTWVAEKVTVYWKAGFNPYTYYGSNNPISFYVPGERKLYILGGESGDVRTADTDHFDDSVILHEYGHFLEDVYGHSDSPGGYHNGNYVIDPRLAWSEGWADYFQSAVQTNSPSIPTSNNGRAMIYIDTWGYKATSGDTRGGASIMISMNQSADSGYDVPLTNEGNFREMSIARTLYKVTRSTASSVTDSLSGGGIPFNLVWETFSGNSQSSPATNSLRNTTTYPVPAMGQFLKLLTLNATANSVSTTNMSSILTKEKQRADTQEYADKVTWKNASCTRTLSGQAEGMPSFADYPLSSQLLNNDFLLYYYSGGSSDANITLAYTPTNGTSGVAMDLDLIVYSASYAYQEDYQYLSGVSNSYIMKQSRRDPLLEPACSFDNTKKCESISLLGKTAGFYMINVKLKGWKKNGSGNYVLRLTSEMNGNAPYDLTDSSGANYLCP